MTKINNISISGFKGVESLEMEVGDINVVTGRNNSGKTSLIQAIDILFNPTKIASFSDNVGAIINKNTNECHIDCIFEKRGQMTIGSFQKEDPFVSERSLEIVTPDDSESISYFLKAVNDIVETGPNTEYYVDRFWGETFAPGEKDDINNIFTQSLREGISQLSEDYLIPRISGNCIILSIENDEYPYVYLGDFYSEIADDVVEIAAKRALSDLKDIDNSNTIATEDLTQSTLERVFSDLMVPRLGKGRFVHERPPRIKGVSFIEDLMVSQGDVDLTEENAAIIVSNIEEYLIKNITSNMKDFSFDSLVFEEDGEPYQIPYSFMGDGFKSFVSILWALYQIDVTNSVFLLEEPEKNMHPGYINELVYRLVDIAKSENLQLFLTTHNPDFISGFLSDNLSDSYGAYLRNEFNIIQMGDRTSQIIPYSRAGDQLKNLNLDLRGL